MLLPTNVSTGRVTGQFLAGVVDGVDGDQEPDAVPAQGFVTFTASVPYLPDPTASPNPATILTTSIVAVLDNDGYLCTPVEGTLEPSYRGVRLIATDDPDLSVEGWTWNATYSFSAVNGQKLSIPTHSFAVPSGGEVDLTTVVKVPSSTGIGTEQAEALAASAQAAAISAAEDAATAAQAAVDAAGAAQVTDANISALVADPATDTADAVTALVDAAASGKLGVDDAINTYQSQAALDAATAAKVGSAGTATNGAVKSIADASAATAAGSKIPSAEKGAANGVATLDASTKIPVGQIPDAVKAGNGAKPVGRGEIVVNVLDYGAKGDWVSGTGTGTDNLAAFNAAFAYAASITGYAVKLYIPAGKYRLSDTWNVYRSSASANTLTIEGADALSTFLVSDFFGSGKDLVALVDPAGVSRCAATNVRKLQFTYASLAGATPVYLNILGGGESRYDELRFQSGNNTHFRASSLQNVRMRDIVSFYGGDHFNYKATDALTFDVTSGGAVTASAAIFTAGDVGKIFNVFPATEDLRIKYTISAVTDSTHATVTVGTGATILAATAAKGYFEAAQASMTSGSTTLTADAPCFTASDVGRVIYVRGARAGQWGVGNLRATITAFTNSSTVTLSSPAEVTVTRAPFTTPAVDFYTTPGASTLYADSNDVKIDLLHIENNYGVGLCTSPNVFFHIDKMKIHGEHDPVDIRHSTAAMWLDDYAGTINGEFDGIATGDSRVHVSNMNDTLTFEWLATRRMRGEAIFKAETMSDPKGFVEVKSFISYKTTVSGNPYDLVTDPNTQPRIVFTGLVNMLGDGQVPRMYVAKDSYFRPDGTFVNGPTTSPGLFASILSGQNGARQLFEDYGTKKFSLGNINGGGTAFTLTDETAALVRLLINTSGAVLPGVDNTQPLGSSTSRWSEVVSTKYTLGSTGVTTTTGTGSPEGVVTAPIGSTYINTTGTAGTIKYGKKSGTGNTGWVAIW